MSEPATDISRHVWETKYRYAERQLREQTIADTWRRVARALAAVEPDHAAVWQDRFFSILQASNSCRQAESTLGPELLAT